MAGLSENKLLRNENKHKEKIKRQIKLFSYKITEFTDENVLLVGDSKVRHLYDVMSDHTHLRMVWRSGAELENNQLTPQVDRYIQRYSKPLIILWFGTCELTEFTDKSRKRDRKKYIDIVPNAANIVNVLINKYTAYKQRRILLKATTRIIFLDIPFYSIVEWNRRKGHPNPQSFLTSQATLETAIIELNAAIKELNNPLLPPHVTLDMYFYIKKKKSHAQTRKIAYALLSDGLQPGRYISKLWLLRIKLFAKRT